MVKIKVKKLVKEAKLPCYAHNGDAGLDVFACEDFELKPGARHAFRTGIALSIPSGYALLVWDKSGLAANFGLKTMAGVIDSGYRGECKIVLFNVGQKSYKIKKGDKIAQLLLQKVENVEVNQVDELDMTERGDGGFGSTGR